LETLRKLVLVIVQYFVMPSRSFEYWCYCFCYICSYPFRWSWVNSCKLFSITRKRI